MGWVVQMLPVAAEELRALPQDMQSRFQRIVALIESRGLLQMREPQVKRLEAPLWEMRMTGRDGISRAIYVAASEQRVVVLRVFVKKTEKTPRSEIEIALRRAKEIQ